MNTKVTKSSVLLWLRRVAAVLLVLSWIPAIISAATLDIVPVKYLAVVGAVYTIIVGVLVWLLLRVPKTAKLKPHHVVVLLAAVLLTMANISGYVLTHVTSDFLSGIQQSKTNYVDYVIVARKDRDVKLETAKTAGVIYTDPLYNDVVAGLKSEISTDKPGIYPNLLALTEAVKTDEIELGTMRKASLDILQENSPETYQSLVVLRTFSVKEGDETTANVDVTKPFVMYVSGIDTYGDVAEVSRSDVNMLMVFNPAKRTILLVNTPRDYYVQLHGTTGTKDKLTHAGIYGINMSRQTMEDLYGVKIASYMRLNFTSLVKIIDTIGPIDVYSDYAFKSYHVGYNTLDSKHALEFARERHSFESGDRQRGRDQQRVIEAIIAKMGQPQNALRYVPILDALQSAVQTNISKDAITKLARMQLDDLKGWHVDSIDVDGTGAMLPTYSMGAQPLYVMQPDQTSLTTAKQRIQRALAQ